ncbi:MAG: metalloregulator ArsR/SmtB family transcription factor [Chloroflexi bacterium]|nr:metalloregulator ArsR/SmtB family transcription factor [Chloroflexota bacterium]
MTEDTSIWTALADEKRRQIINLLEEKPHTTSDLSKSFDVSRFAIMKHLKVLERANLIEVKREGRKRWNILNDDLAHFLRSKLKNENSSSRLVDILGLFPGKQPTLATVSLPVSPVQIEQNILLQASPSQVFEALTGGIDAWWGQRVSTNSQVYLEPYVNGRFYEAFNTSGQGVLYATVTYIKQDEELRLKGTVELTEQVANAPVPDNFVRISLKLQDDATLLTLNHHMTRGVDEMTHDFCSRCWHVLLHQHLKPFVDDCFLCPK